MLKAIGLDRKELRAWALYDWANSAFATTIMAAVLPIYYADVACAGLEPNEATARWGYTASLALLIVVVIAPVLGAASDYMGARKKFLFSFMGLGVCGSAGLYFVSEGDWLLASGFFILGNIGFAAANVFYESLLPHLAGPQEVDKVSTAGYAIGYLGGGTLLALNSAWILMPDTFGFADAGAATRWSFVSVGIWWALFTLPIMRHVSEPKTVLSSHESAHMNPLTVGFSRLLETMRDIGRHKQLLLFLAAFWLYNDGVNTIIKMAAIYGREIGLDRGTLIGALLLVQFVGIPFSFAFGALAVRIGAKNGVMISLVVYSLMTVLGYYMSESWHFWVLAVMLATVQGGCQALSRSLFSRMVPKDKSAQYFGFYSVSAKFAGIFGPLIFGVIADLTGSSRNSILFIIVFFLVGMYLLSKVDVEAGEKAALQG